MRILCTILIFAVSLAACKDKLPKGFEEGDQYFSVSQFLDDQWKNKSHLPITMMMLSEFEGKKDSTFVNWDSTFFKNVRVSFDKADISNKKFLGKYKFTPVDDAENGVLNLHFEALDEDLYTRLLVVGMDPLDQTIKSIYMETNDEGLFSSQQQKLSYVPNDFIQIISQDKKLFGNPKTLFLTYKISY